MWEKISHWVIRYRVFLLVLTGLITVFMAYKAKDLEMTYDFVGVVPENDPDNVYFREFKKTFGEDGNIMVVGMKSHALFKYKNFQKLQSLTDSLKKIEGVAAIVSLPTMQNLVKDEVNKKFVMDTLFKKHVSSQKELDSILRIAKDTRFYQGLIWNQNSDATLVAITFKKEYLNSSKRVGMVDHIRTLCNEFGKEVNTEIHFAGLPYVRAIMMKDVGGELKLFLVLAILVTSVILYFVFRSTFAVAFTFLVIVILVIWTLGTIVLFGYKVTLLTGMLPALIIIISIPNCIYMYNKYHHEYKKTGNKLRGVQKIISKVGFLTFMTNANTAVGFLCLYFTDITIIEEFGMVAGIISLVTFFITLIVIPGLLLYLPEPSEKQLMHLDFALLRRINILLEYIVLRHRAMIFGVAIVLLCISAYGITKINAVSYMVDDLPETSNVKSDLAFFEKHFNGVMPLEIVVDFGKPQAVLLPANLKKLQEFEDFLKTIDQVSPPLSILNIIKGIKQAYYGGNPEFYTIPKQNELLFLKEYIPKGSQSDGLLKSFVDSTGKVRITAKVADIGTNRMNLLIDKINKGADEIFKGKKIKVKTTGTTLLFLKGNQYLINDLSESLFWAFVMISLMMAMIFTNVKMIIISLIPNIIPMILTAGIMGLYGIPLKPSTALIFSIAFGISIDSTIHYLAKFKQEMQLLNNNILRSVTISLEEEGVSIIYTSIVLFCGFIIFAFSNFGGTIALGILTSLTLFFAMFTNLLLLPSLLLTLNKGNQKNIYILGKTPFRFYTEEDDEEIDLSKIAINKIQKEKLDDGEEV